MREETGLRVERLRPGGGAAEAAGLKPGDLIENFGELSAGQVNATTLGGTVVSHAGRKIAVRYLRKADGSYVEAELQLPEVISAWDFAGREALKVSK